MRNNVIRFPRINNKPELIDELKGSLVSFYSSDAPACDIEKSLMATSIFHFLIASKIALDHIGKSEESGVILGAVQSMESNWPHYESSLDGLLKDLAPYCRY